ALRELFARLADQHRIVVVLEDMQWMDQDSRALFGELLRPPNAPALLFVGTLRTTPETDVDAIVESFGDVPFERIALGPLAPRDAERLAAAMFAGSRKAPAW